MKEDRKYIKIKPDDFSEADFKIAIKVENLLPMPPECECWICEEKGSHLAPSHI